MNRRRVTRRGVFTAMIVTLACIVPDRAPAMPAQPTARQALLAKVRPLVNAYAAKRHWRITDPLHTTTSISGARGYGSVAASYEGDGVMAVVGWDATLTRKHGRWLVTRVRVSNVTRIDSPTSHGSS